MPRPREGSHGGGRLSHVRGCCPKRAHHELEGCLDLGAIGRRCKELGRGDDCSHDLAQIALGPGESFRRAIDEVIRRGIAHEALGELERDVASSRRMRRDDVQDFFAVFNATAGRKIVPEHFLRAAIVHGRDKAEPGIGGPANRPPRKRSRDLDDILLGVAAIHTERVQLQQLSRVVFVEAARHPVGGVGIR